MSLINQMLQDLEKRRPGSDSRPLSEVRAVSRQRRQRLFWPSLLLAAAAGALAWQLWQSAPSREAAPVTAAVPAPETPPAAIPEPEKEEEAGAEAPPEPVRPAEAQPAMLAGSRTTALPDLKESTELAPSSPLAAMPPPKPARPPEAAAPAAPSTAPPAGPQPAEVAMPVGVAKQVRELTPRQRAESEYRKALALVQQGRVNEALDTLNQALLLDAQHGAARQTLIGLLVESRRYDEAERRLQEGLNQDRAQAELAMTLARLQVERGDSEAAIATLEHSQSAAIDRADYHAFMAALLQRESRHHEAIEHYRQALRRTPSAVWQMGLGISLQAENRLQEAREAFSRAKAANTLSPELQAFVEQRLKQLGQ